MGVGPSHESRMVDWILHRPGFHRFVGYLHTRFRHIRHGKTQEEMMEEMGGTNLKERKTEERLTLLKHFKDELGNQMRDLRGGSRNNGNGGSGGGGTGGGGGHNG